VTKEEFQEFVDWQDYEGGLIGLLRSHGVGVFPEELQPAAIAVGIALDRLDRLYRAAGTRLGVLV